MVADSLKDFRKKLLNTYSGTTANLKVDYDKAFKDLEDFRTELLNIFSGSYNPNW